jgi:CubicO group peptidase (beta-lactamase class C family)
MGSLSLLILRIFKAFASRSTAEWTFWRMRLTRLQGSTVCCYLYLHDGSWGGHQIVSSAWVRSSIEPKVAVKPGVAYGYNWWINTAHTPPIFEAEGSGGQRITVIRDKDPVIAFTGGGDNTDELAPFLLRSLESDGKPAKNPRAKKQLQSLVRLAKQAPPPRSASHKPTEAYNISERTLTFERNPLHLEAMTFHFAHGKDPRITLRLADETYDHPSARIADPLCL